MKIESEQCGVSVCVRVLGYGICSRVIYFSFENHECIQDLLQTCFTNEIILPYHDKRNQLTFLAKLSYYLEMVKDDDIYLINSKKFNYIILTLKLDHLKIENHVQVNGSSSQFLAIISNNQ